MHTTHCFELIRRKCYESPLYDIIIIRLIILIIVVAVVVCLFVFTALHAMQTRSSDEISVCPSVCPSVCQTRAL